MAHTNSLLIQPGAPGHAELCMLATAHGKGSDTEEILANCIFKLGLGLGAKMETVDVSSDEGPIKHTCVCIRSLAEEVLRQYPRKLLNGFGMDELNAIHGCFRSFWRAFKNLNPLHPVYKDHADRLQWCLPCKMHMDEGTGVRKHPIFQLSWSPIFKQCYFYFSCLPHELYKLQQRGYELGNPVVDSLLHNFTIMARSVYFEGIQAGQSRFYLVWVAAEGDLPALSKCFHCKRNWGCEPNECCFWCSASDRSDDMAYSNLRPSARWRSTIGASRPWSVEGALAEIPGANHENFLSKDIFHICHLGITRTFCASMICYMAHAGYFPSNSTSRSVDVKLQQACKEFRYFCKSVLGATPHVKVFSRENLNWSSRSFFPECSWKASDMRLLLAWMIDFCDRPFQHNETMIHAMAALRAMDSSLRLMYTRDRVFLSRTDAALLSGLLKDFCREYLHCAVSCYEGGDLYFNLTPKFHYTFHVALELDKQLDSSNSLRVINPAVFSTQQAESYIGVVSTISRTVHPLSVSRRVAMKFLIRARHEFRQDTA